MKKILALGHQEFSKVIGNNCIYVDKTETIYKLVTGGTYYFLSRPRRFGKSLLANTIKELYLGNEELFKGLWIYDKWDWKTNYPVIKMSFAEIAHDVLGLEQAINNMLKKIARKYNIFYETKSYPEKFRELIEKLSKKEQVIIIIDEYDKPIIDYMDDMKQAEENRKILKNFYSVLKDSDKYIKFLFITGVSKFSKVSIFSDLNNLSDITVDENFSQIVGWTKEEIVKYFPEYIEDVAEKYKEVFPDIMAEIKKWYNGYSWDGKTSVYNPWSLMSLFKTREFGNYWFDTGTPTFLTELIKKRRFNPFELENKVIPSLALNKYEIKSMTLLPLLFQTGYLTIKNKPLGKRIITLGYPNFEVEEAFTLFLLSKLTLDKIDRTSIILYNIVNTFIDNKIELFIKYISILLKNISYNIVDSDRENYFHSMFFLIMKMTGFDIEVEIETINGRIDAVVKTDDNIYIIEFKVNLSADKAIQQIKDKKYALKYANDKRNIYLLGINFDTYKKEIENWKMEKYLN